MRISKFLLLSSSVLVLTSCEYKDLCYDHNHWATVKVSFDWQKAPEATAKGMTVLFYQADAQSSEPVRYDFGLEGGTARLDPEAYHAVCYNNDTEAILYRGSDNTNTLEAYTRKSSIEEGTQLMRSGMPRAAGTEEQTVILEPDPLWGAAKDVPALLPNSRDVSLVFQPEYRYLVVHVTIINVPNLQYTGSFAGALSGLAPSVFMASGQLGEGMVTEAFVARQVDETTLSMSCNIFGHCPRLSEGESNEHILTVYAILADGSKWYYSIDVTEKMHQGAVVGGEQEIDIVIDGLPVPKPIVNGSGFQPTVDGWQGVEIDVGM